VDTSLRLAYRLRADKFGVFEVNFGLRTGIDFDNAGAEYKDGFLTIVFPKIHVKHIEVE